MIQASGIDHIVLHVADVQRSKKFYTERLGMEVYRENDRQVFLHAGTQGVALFRRGESDPVAAGGDLNHLALRVAGGTYESLKGELEAHGVAVSGRLESPRQGLRLIIDAGPDTEGGCFQSEAAQRDRLRCARRVCDRGRCAHHEGGGQKAAALVRRLRSSASTARSTPSAPR